MLRYGLDEDQFNRLLANVGGSIADLRKQLATAVNATAKTTRRNIGARVRKKVIIKKASVERVIKIGKQANTTTISSVIEIDPDRRISLKEFGLKQTKKGVSYRISKEGGRKTINNGFIVGRLGSHAFTRLGKSRLPIAKLFGPSPFGVFEKNDQLGPTSDEASAELVKQVEKRIRFLTLKAEGKLRGNQPTGY